MTKAYNSSTVLKFLEWTYERVVMSSPVPGVENAQALAERFLQQQGSLQQQVDSLIRWQNTKAATIGFATSFGGVAALPLTLSSNLATVLFIQMRMIAAIAIMGGYDVHDHKVKAMVFACLCGTAAIDVFKDLGIQLGTHFTRSMLLKLNQDVVNQLRNRVGMKLLAKMGGAGAINFTKAVPLVGGVIGATFDGFTTHMIGKMSKNIFVEERS